MLHRRSGFTEETTRRIADDAFLELSDRLVSCGSGNRELNRYPFSLTPDGTLLSLRRPFRLDSNFGLLYWFLLLVTRADMSSRARVLDGTDPTKVFELLCADVLASNSGEASPITRGQWLSERPMQRGRRTSKQKLPHCARALGKAKVGRKGRESLAVVTPSSISLHGGASPTNGKAVLLALPNARPASIGRTTSQDCTRDILEEIFSAIPDRSTVRLYMVPNRIVSHQWEQHSMDGGILLDRCRIVQYGNRVSPPIVRQCRRSVHAAYRTQRSRRVTI